MKSEASRKRHASDVNVSIIDRSISAKIAVETAFVNTNDRSIIARIADIW